MGLRIGVVTDSSANLTPADAAALGIAVVPLRVVIGGVQYLEGTEVSAEVLTEALRSRVTVTTSRPGPQAFLAEYARLRDAGCHAVVSVHLSREVSGTYESAVLAAGEAPLPVEVVDSRTLGLGLGFAVLAAARAAAHSHGEPAGTAERGAWSAEEEAAAAAERGAWSAQVQPGETDLADRAARGAAAVARVAAERAASSSSLFYVDTLEYLRRGGRVGTARALIGSALAVKPLLHVHAGRIELLERVRTSSRARVRLADLAVERAGDQDVDLAVQHLAASARAEELADQLRDRLPQVEDIVVREVGAAVGAHVGPGMIAVVVSPRGS